MHFLKKHLIGAVVCIILFEIALASILLIKLNLKKEIVEVKSASTSIAKENITIPLSELNYYYDLKPNSEQIWNNSKLKDITTHYKINTDGLNETTNYSKVKPPHTFRIVTLGDSMTFGLYVPTQDNFPKKLELALRKQPICTSRVQKYDVINLGVPGYDLRYAVEKFQQKGRGYEPDLVIWTISFEDLTEILEYMRPIMDTLNKKGQGLTSRQEAKEKLFLELTQDEILSYQQSVLNEFANTYDRPVIFVSWSAFDTKQERLMSEFLENHKNFYFLSLKEKIGSEHLILNDPHLNALGHQEVASSLYKYIRNSQFIRCDAP